MKIMAGIDKEFLGEAWPGENVTVGYLPQEPQLDASKTVLETSRTAPATSPTWSTASTPSRPKWATQGRYRLRQADGGDGRTPGQDRRGRRWTLDNQLEVAMEALRCPPSDSAVPISRAVRSAASR